MMRKTLTIIVTGLILILAGSVTAQPADYDGYLSIDSVQARAGDQFGVKVRLHDNDVAFSGLFVPIRYDSPYLTFDSVSFSGSIKPGNFSDLVFDFVDPQIVQATYVPPYENPLPTIDVSGGIVAEFFFTLSDQATPQFIVIDSASIDTPIWAGIVLASSDGLTMWAPGCVAGGVEVLAPTGVNDGVDMTNLPTEFALAQNYPNPFNPSTMIEYAMPTAGSVRLEVFNVLGQSKGVLVDRYMPAGVHTAQFDATAYPSGIYFYRLSYENGSETKKMVLLK